MSNVSLGLPPDLHSYLVRHGVREPDILRRLREETASLPQHDMQIAPEQGALMALLVQLSGARRAIELGTFTGYSSLAVALAMPPDGTIVCCDVSDEWTSVARRYWAEAGVAGVGPAPPPPRPREPRPPPWGGGARAFALPSSLATKGRH